jgi:hypothetical protein
MRRQLLAIALGASIGFSVAAVNAAPGTNMLETLKASTNESGAVQQVYYRRGYHHHHHHRNCWWGDRWLCSRMW